MKKFERQVDEKCKAESRWIEGAPLPKAILKNLFGFGDKIWKGHSDPKEWLELVELIVHHGLFILNINRENINTAGIVALDGESVVEGSPEVTTVHPGESLRGLDIEIR